MKSTLSRPNLNQKLEYYISNCDLINKYNLTTVYNIPRVKKISLELNLKDFLLSSDLSEKNQKHALSQIKSYLLLYIILGFKPRINYNKNIDLNKTITKEALLNYSLKLTFSTKKELNNILSTFFVENSSKLKLDGFNLFNGRRVNTKTNDLNNFLFSTIIPGNSFSEVENFFKDGLNFKNLNYKLNISILNPSLKNENNIIKNLPFFWISG